MQDIMDPKRPPDVEVGQSAEARRDGYPAVAAWMARDPDNETFIYRKFDRLSARNLLNLQSELIYLELKLESFDNETWTSGDQDLKQSARKWETFVKNAEVREEEKKRMELNREIRIKLREYHETLLLLSQVANLDRPSSRVFSAFHNWFTGGIQEQDGRKIDPVLGGRAKDMLDDPRDLAALRTPADKDLLSRFLQNHWPFPVRRAKDPRDKTGHYLEKYVVWVVAIVSTVVAAILLIGAIVGLYVEQSPVARLAMISCFTALFALSVGLLTNARRAEIFASTAAYAAVLVVFVSGNLGSNSPV